MPPLALVVRSTSQQADTTGLVASMARKYEGASTSTRIDQWILLGHEGTKEEKDKKGHGKGEDKGKLSPRCVVQLGARSSTGFMGVSPPLSSCRGGAVPGPIPTMGGADGGMKLEPLAKFTRKGFPNVWDSVEETADWLEVEVAKLF